MSSTGRPFQTATAVRIRPSTSAPRSRIAPRSHLVAAGIDQVAVRRELQRPAEQLPGDRLRVVQALLHRVLAPHAEALAHERVLVDLAARIARGEAVGDEAVRLEERTEDVRREEHGRALEHVLDLPWLRRALLPARIEDGQLGAQVVGEDALAR